MSDNRYDRIIIGAGLYGLYSALYCGRQGLSVLVLEADDEPFSRATYINQARVHMGYHYPRSLTTATKSAHYFRRFCEDYDFCIHRSFDQIYATSSSFSWTGADQFMEFCDAAGIRCDEVPVSKYFNHGMCDGAFLTEEYTYDAHILRDKLIDDIAHVSGITLKCTCPVTGVERDGDMYVVRTGEGDTYETGFVLNTTYASVNQIIGRLFPDDLFALKYELCEIILCDVNEGLSDTGITVMDGPFFSIMPFGLTGLHSLTSVTFTPHETSYEDTPVFRCQHNDDGDAVVGSCGERICTPDHLCNCNLCAHKPESSWDYMSHLARKYMKPEYEFEYRRSLYSMKPILKSSEVDDSRPTAIRVHSGSNPGEPTFISVLSGKINTVYDLDEYLM